MSARARLAALGAAEARLWPAVLAGDAGACRRYARLLRARSRVLGLSAPAVASWGPDEAVLARPLHHHVLRAALPCRVSLVLPPGLLPGATEFRGLPVVRGGSAALLLGPTT